MDITLSLGYSASMIWIPVGLCFLSPALVLGLCWWLIRFELGRFQGEVLGAIQESIRLQDDRIRKVRAPDKPRKPAESDGISFNTPATSVQYYPGQPIE